MINQGYVEGIRVVSATPFPYEKGVDVSTSIEITLNTNPNTSSIYEAIKILDGGDADKDDLPDHLLEAFDKFPFVECLSTYNHESKTIVLKPREYLAINKKYIIIVEGLIDIFGNKQVDPYTSVFYTSELDTHKPVELLYPADNTVHKDIPEFKWLKLDTYAYIFEIARDHGFTDLVYRQEVVFEKDNIFENTLQFTPSVTLDEGTYFWRIRAEDGNWSVINTFYYQPFDVVPITEEDEAFKDAALEEIFKEESLEVLVTNIKQRLFDTNANVLYFKLSKEISHEDIHEILLYSESDDSEKEFDYTIIVDNADKSSYLIIVPKAIGGE